MATEKVLASSLLLHHFSEILGTIVLLLLPYGLYRIWNSQRPYPNIPLVCAEGGFAESKKRYIANSIDVVKRATEQSKGVCQIITDNGPRILIPHAYLEEIKDGKQLSFTEWIREDLLADYKGFEALHFGLQDGVFSEVVRVKLTQSLTRLTSILSDETAACLHDLLPNTQEWTTTDDPFYAIALQLVSRLTSRAFLGERLCRDKDWLRISIEFTKDIFLAIPALRKYPPFLRPFVRPFLPEVRRVMAHQAAASKIIEPELQRRRKERDQLGGGGGGEKAAEKPLDSLTWIDEVSAARRTSGFDVVMGQLSMTVAAVHTTSMALTNTMYDLVAHPDLVAELRREIVAVMGGSEPGGAASNPAGAAWQKTTLARLRLLDSAMKETQRLNPTGVFNMRRRTSAPVTLSDGTRIPAGAMITVPTLPMREAGGGLYPDPEVYDGRRFLRLRELPGNENRWQFATTSREMYAFGHGKHACPGRFFAGNEVKIALVHLLMKYDWKFVGEKQGVEGRPKTIVAVESYRPDPTVRLMCRARTPEIAL